MKNAKKKIKTLIKLDIEYPIWDHVFTIAPLVIIGSKEGDDYDLAPKHMATPLGFKNYFGFVCTPSHSTYHNIVKTGEFTVSFPKPDQVLISALAASPRCQDLSKNDQVIRALPTFKASAVDGLFVSGCYLYLECKCFKVVDGFDENVLVCGRIIKAMADSDYVKTSDMSSQDQIYSHPMLAYLAHGRYARISESFVFPFPKDFKR